MKNKEVLKQELEKEQAELRKLRDELKLEEKPLDNDPHYIEVCNKIDDLYDEIPILSTYLGHENIHGTERYLHMTEVNGTDILRCMESLNDNIFPEVIP